MRISRGEDVADDAADELTNRVARKIKNCSCSALLDSKKQGNQERRLNDLLESLLEKPEENSGHIAYIRSHQSLVQLAKVTAIKMLPGLSSEELNANMARLKAAGVALSAEYKLVVFSKCINSLLTSLTTNTQQGLDSVLMHLELHTDTKTEFDPTFPKLSALDQPLAMKFKNFQKYVMEKVFTMTLGKGETMAPILTRLSAKLLEAFENMSPDIDLPVNSNAIVMDCITIWRCIVAIETESLDGNISVEDMQSFTDAVHAVHEASQLEGSRNINAIIGRLLMTSPYWSQKLTGFVDTRAAWEDIVPKVRSTVQVLTSALPGHSDTTGHLSRASDLHFLSAERLRSAAYSSLTEQLLKTTTDHINAMMLHSAGDDTLQAASAALQSVSMALPNSETINSLTDDLASCARTLQNLQFRDFKLKPLKLCPCSPRN